MTDEDASVGNLYLSADGKSLFYQEIGTGRVSAPGIRTTYLLYRTPANLGLAPAASQGASTWTRLAADHPWPDEPRWSPDGRTLYFLSRSASSCLAL